MDLHKVFNNYFQKSQNQPLSAPISIVTVGKSPMKTEKFRNQRGEFYYKKKVATPNFTTSSVVFKHEWQFSPLMIKFEAILQTAPLWEFIRHIYSNVIRELPSRATFKLLAKFRIQSRVQV